MNTVRDGRKENTALILAIINLNERIFYLFAKNVVKRVIKGAVQKGIGFVLVNV